MKLYFTFFAFAIVAAVVADGETESPAARSKHAMESVAKAAAAFAASSKASAHAAKAAAYAVEAVNQAGVDGVVDEKENSIQLKTYLNAANAASEAVRSANFAARAAMTSYNAAEAVRSAAGIKAAIRQQQRN